MEKISIFGHKKPDTDSVTSAIALSYLKNKLGLNTEARILGHPNNETKFVLNHFNEEEPKYLNDVKLQIKDLNYLKNCARDYHDTIYNCFLYMNEYNIGSIPIVNQNKFVGLVSLKDIAKHQINDRIDNLCTSYDNIIKTLNAKEILKFDDEVNGDVVVTTYSSTTFIENISLNKNTILIVGDRHSIIEYAIKSKVKMIILTKNSFIKDEHLALAREYHINIILSNESSFDTTRKIWLSNYVDTVALKDNVVTISEDEDVDDFVNIAKKNKYTNYPVINKEEKCLGILRLSDINDVTKKKVILVDHNEIQQSVDGIEEAEILEIIDHHKIGNLDTKYPISFRNMPVGSTNTIIYSMFKENNLEIPKSIAGLMLSGIISDTLLFRSPTTTSKDKEAVFELANIAEVDYEAYGMEMLKAGSSLKNKTKEEVLYSDFKNFNVNNDKIGIGQILTLSPNDVLDELDEYVKLVNEVAEHNDKLIIALFVTDIIKNGSYIIYNESAKDILDNCFNTPDLHEGMFLPDYISRKKQIIPNIIDVLEKNKIYKFKKLIENNSISFLFYYNNFSGLSIHSILHLAS